MRQFVDVSGLGHTGKAVVTDLLKEFDKVWVPENLFEFDLIRVPGGLLDLQYALVEDWSIVRSNAAIHRFEKVAIKMGTVAKLSSPSSLYIAYGTNYDAFFCGQFYTLTREFVSSLVGIEYDTEWPYPLLDESPSAVLFNRASRFFKRSKNQAESHFKFAVPSESEFRHKATLYLNRLFDLHATASDQSIVLNNAFEPFNPNRSVRMLDNSKCIIVDRDPRDIYASLFVKDGAYVPQFLQDGGLWRLKASFLAAGNIDSFIYRQKMLNEIAARSKDDPSILRISYEDLVLKYEASLLKVREFLGWSSSDHIHPKKYFDPTRSKLNIGLWEKMGDSEEIEKITLELKDMCYLSS